MIKYTADFKLKVVKHYLKGTEGYRLLSAQYGVASPHIRNWVSAYKIHGMEGLVRKRTLYDAKFKLTVLQHMWDNCLSKRNAAALYNVRNPTSIERWETIYREGGIEALAPLKRMPKITAPTASPELKPAEESTREELLQQNAYLRMEVEVLKKLQALVQARKTPAPKKRR